jgi:N-acyl-L-homoserine lactone synthetase
MNSVRHDLTEFINKHYCDYLKKYYRYEATEPDEFTDNSIYAAAYKEGEIVGAIRLILGPHTQISDLVPGKTLALPEISRMIVAPEHSGDHVISRLLIHEASVIAMELQYEELVAAINRTVFRIVTQLKYRFKRISDDPCLAFGQAQYVIQGKSADLLDHLTVSPFYSNIVIKRVYPSIQQRALAL